MTMVEMIAIASALSCVSVDVLFDTRVIVTVEDFVGFDEDYAEQIVDYDEEAVDNFEEMLHDTCVSYYGDFVRVYEFDGYTVEIHFASEDI